MDIEPLWALGGWFIFLDCMAAETFTKSSSLLCFVSLFCILLLLHNSSTEPTTINPSEPASASSSVTVKRVLLDSSKSSSSTTSTMNLNPKPSKRKATRKEIGAAAHDVPSGPNPISNRARPGKIRTEPEPKLDRSVTFNEERERERSFCFA